MSAFFGVYPVMYESNNKRATFSFLRETWDSLLLPLHQMSAAFVVWEAKQLFHPTLFSELQLSCYILSSWRELEIKWDLFFNGFFPQTTFAAVKNSLGPWIQGGLLLLVFCSLLSFGNFRSSLEHIYVHMENWFWMLAVTFFNTRSTDLWFHIALSSSCSWHKPLQWKRRLRAL